MAADLSKATTILPVPPAPNGVNTATNGVERAPRVPARRDDGGGRSFADELARDDARPANKAPARNDSSPARDSDDHLDRDNHNDAGPAKARRTLSTLKKAAQGSKQDIDGAPVVAFLTGHLEKLEPTTIPGLVSSNRFVNEALSQDDLAGYLNQPTSIQDMVQALDLPNSVLRDAQAMGLDLHQRLAPTEILKALGVDPQRVFAELKLLKDNATLDGLSSYMSRALTLAQKDPGQWSMPSGDATEGDRLKSSDNGGQTTAALAAGMSQPTLSAPAIKAPKSPLPTSAQTPGVKGTGMLSAPGINTDLFADFQTSRVLSQDLPMPSGSILDKSPSLTTASLPGLSQNEFADDGERLKTILAAALNRQPAAPSPLAASSPVNMSQTFAANTPALSAASVATQTWPTNLSAPALTSPPPALDRATYDAFAALGDRLRVANTLVDDGTKSMPTNPINPASQGLLQKPAELPLTGSALAVAAQSLKDPLTPDLSSTNPAQLVDQWRPRDPGLNLADQIPNTQAIMSTTPSLGTVNQSDLTMATLPPTLPPQAPVSAPDIGNADAKAVLSLLNARALAQKTSLAESDIGSERLHLDNLADLQTTSRDLARLNLEPMARTDATLRPEAIQSVTPWTLSADGAKAASSQPTAIFQAGAGNALYGLGTPAQLAASSLGQAVARSDSTPSWSIGNDHATDRFDVPTLKAALANAVPVESLRLTLPTSVTTEARFGERSGGDHGQGETSNHADGGVDATPASEHVEAHATGAENPTQHVAAQRHTGGNSEFGAHLAESSENSISTKQRWNLMQQVIDRATAFIRGGNSGSMRLDLSSPELGPVEMAINLQDDRLDLRVMTGSKHIRDAMMSGLGQLRNALSVQQVQLGKVEVGSGRQQQAPDFASNFAAFQGQAGRGGGQGGGASDRRTPLPTDSYQLPGIRRAGVRAPAQLLANAMGRPAVINETGRIAVRV